jgi:outer membrane immunogenic protein
MKRLSLMAFTLVALTGALAATTAASAADLRAPVYKAPQPPPLLYAAPYNWSGFYVGGNGGYAWGKADIDSSVGSSSTDSTTGWMFGATIGFNQQTGQFVWGFEGDFDYALIKGNPTNVVGSLCVGGGCEVKSTFVGTARARLGYAMDRFLPYITGGGAIGSLKISAPNGASETNTPIGWTVGGGLEYGLDDGWSVKADYLYTQFSSTTCTAATCGVDTSYKIRYSTVRGGFNYRF